MANKFFFDPLINKLSAAISDFLYPQFCLNCNIILNSDTEIIFCKGCSESVLIPPSYKSVCNKCGKIMSSDLSVPPEILLCSDCSESKIFFEQARHIYNYNGIIETLIKRFKYYRETDASYVFSNQIFKYLKTADYNVKIFDFIVNVPMTDLKIKQRGVDHIDILCSNIAEKSKIPYAKNVLIKIKDTKQQAGLSRNDRITNLKKSFKFNTTDYSSELFFEKNILVIDDVFSTGTTVNECCKIFKKKCKSAKLYVLTIARGM
ncbi:ComF family protein [Candidatus Dependentiae bacterium]|nr:ComF family protein [Candidatus Dependentiae bacterium]